MGFKTVLIFPDLNRNEEEFTLESHPYRVYNNLRIGLQSARSKCAEFDQTLAQIDTKDELSSILSIIFQLTENDEYYLVGNAAQIVFPMYLFPP